MSEPYWIDYSREALLDLQLAELGIVDLGPLLESCQAQVARELEQRGLRFRPRIWVSDEWFSPDGIGGFAAPFYLTHPHLKRLERATMHWVEGGTRRDCLRLMRHETGHALQHAYRFERQRGWREAFGRSSIKYPDRYRPDPSSRAFVHHLPYWYAQCHPDEDFAETFAVWLAPRSGWRRRYVGWPAHHKLVYVDGLMTDLARAPAPRASQRAIDPLSRLSTTLRDHYQQRRARYARERSTSLDEALRELLGRRPPPAKAMRAATVLGGIRAAIERRVAPRSPEAAYALSMLYHDLVGRCHELRLSTGRSPDALARDAARLLRTHVATLLDDPSSREWIPV